MTGRLRDQWHGMSRTGTVARLFGHVSEPSVQMHPQDMARGGLQDADLVYLTSPRGSLLVPVQPSHEVALSHAFMAMHWGEEYLGGRASSGHHLAGVNALTTGVFCPDSRQPELKHTAIKILKAELPWSLLALAWLPPEEVLRVHQALQRLMPSFPFASCVPFANNVPADAPERSRTGVLLRAAGHEAASHALLDRIEAMLGLDGAQVLRYADKNKGQRRAIRLERGATQTTLEGFMLAGDTRAQGWIKTLLQDELPAQSYGRALLAPDAKPPVAVQSRGKQVCSCFNVTQTAIAQHLGACNGSAKERLDSLQGELQCGTNCGSCLPELQRMVRTSMDTNAATAS